MKTRLEYRISRDCRRPKECKEVFLKWINTNPEFHERKPTVEELIAECQRKGSSLTILMEQNHRKAAAHYWRAEAQYYLRCVTVVRIEITTGREITKPIRAYIPVRYSANGHIREEDYIPAQRVATNGKFKHSVIERARSDFLAWLSRYERYAEFMDVFHAVVKAFRELEAQLEEVVAAG